MSVAALSWPFDWGRLSKLDRFLLGMPLIGAQAKAKRHIDAQLRGRTPECLRLWSPERVDLARRLSDILAFQFRWPNALFIPDDPLQILCWDAGAYAVDDLRCQAALIDLEKSADRVLPDEEVESLLRKRFGEVVDVLSGRPARSSPGD